jgi:hypothetical protein
MSPPCLKISILPLISVTVLVIFLNWDVDFRFQFALAYTESVAETDNSMAPRVG